MKRIAKYLFFSFFIIFFGINYVKADEWNGAGATYTGCKITPATPNCECGQGNSQLCLWDNKNHVLLKVSLYYFKEGQDLDSAHEIGYEIYGNGNYSLYVGDLPKTVHVLTGFPTSSIAGISGPARSYFYENVSNFINLFNMIVGTGYNSSNTTVGQAEVKSWMEEYCKQNGYGNKLQDCHTSMGGNKGFRIIIQPIITGIYGSTNIVKVGTVKSMFNNNNIWNQSSTKKAYSAIMYLDRNDITFTAGSSTGTTDNATVGSARSGYGLNSFSWPVDIETGICNPDVSGIEYCCILHNIDSFSSSNNNTTKLTRKLTVDEINTYCKNTKKCNPDSVGVKTCCERYSITGSNTANNNLTNLTRLLTASEISTYCDGGNPSSCSYKLKTKIPSVCSSSTNGEISDDASWDCIFTSTKRRDTTVKNNYVISSFDNDYCAIYCKEEITYNYPIAGANAYSGTYFYIASSSGFKTIGPISYTGKKTCRVTDEQDSDNGVINVEQFKKDFKKADDAVLLAYDIWQFAILYNSVIDSATSVPWGPETCSCDSHGCCDEDPLCTDGACFEGCTSSESGTYYTYTNKDFDGSTNAYKNKNTGISNGNCSCVSCDTCGKYCDPKATKQNVAALRANYDLAVQKRDDILTALKMCNNFYDKYVEFEPKIKFKYEDKVYEFNDYLKVNGSASSSTSYSSSGKSTIGFTSVSQTYNNTVANKASSESGMTYSADGNAVRGYYDYINYYKCEENPSEPKGCKTISQYQYPTNVWFEQTTTRKYTYTLPDDLYKYVEKETSESVSSKPAINYEVIEVSNLPVHYSTPPGNYNYYVEVTTYGNGNKFDKYIINNTRFNSESYKKDIKYECTYIIECEPAIVCNSCSKPCDSTDEGTDLIYRTISLYYPFPGQNATQTINRNPGSNWNQASTISSYITNARGVKQYEIYRLSPMYEIDLTPSLMRKIKDYNADKRKETIRVYEGSSAFKEVATGYSDFSLKCRTGTNGAKSRECKSDIIRDWGVTGCAISGTGSYTNCGTTVAW